MNKNIPRHGREVGQIRRLIHEAMSIWQHNSNLKLSESGDDDADVLIDFARGNHGDNFNFNGIGGTLGEIFPKCNVKRLTLIGFVSLVPQPTRSILARASEATFTWTTTRFGTSKWAAIRTMTPLVSSTRCCTSSVTHLASVTRRPLTQSCFRGTRHRGPSTVLKKSSSTMISSPWSSFTVPRMVDDVSVPTPCRRRHDALQRQ